MSSELDSIVKPTKSTSEMKEAAETNLVADILTYIGSGVLVLGIIAGIYIGSNYEDTWVNGISLIVSSFISGILFVGFGEVIRILHDIRANTKNK